MSEEVLTPIFTSLRDRLKHSAMRLLRRQEDADDALQEAFCRLWTRRDGIKTSEDAVALANVTLKNVSIDILRKQRLRTSEEIKHDYPANTDDNEEQHERFIRVEKIIKQYLTPLQQDVLMKKEYQGESISDIAKEMGTTPAAIAMQLSRARKIIREQYVRLNVKH